MPDHDDWWPNYFADYGQYLESMRRLADLNAQILCLSHNGVIQGADQVKAYFDGVIEATEQYHGRIVDQLFNRSRSTLLHEHAVCIKSHRRLDRTFQRRFQ